MSNADLDFPAIEGFGSGAKASGHPLVKAVSNLFQVWGAVDLDDTLEPSARKGVREVLVRTIDKGVNQGSAEDLKALHFTLDELLRLRFSPNQNKLEMSPFLFGVQQTIIKAVYNHDVKEIADKGGYEGIEDFRKWYDGKVAAYAQGPHELFTYAEKDAGINGFKYIVQQEAGVHVPFDDVLAFAQIGVHGEKKVEFFHNLEDEMGSGDASKFHMTMLGRLLKELEITRINKEDLTWQSLACGNYMMFLSHFRSFYHESTGYLGFVEALTPARFSKLARAGKRFGLSDDATEFHASHSELDIEHAQGWLDKIIIPEIEANPAKAKAIATGVLLREEVSKRYWDVLLENARAADTANPEPRPAGSPAQWQKNNGPTKTNG
jgi:hypothetical protein